MTSQRPPQPGAKPAPLGANPTSSKSAPSPAAAAAAPTVPLAPTAVTDALSLKWNSKVACRTLEGTAFILLKSRMVSLNEVGTFIWEQFEKGSTIEGVAAQVVKQFETSLDAARTDAREFVRALVEKEMLVPVGPIT